MSGIVKATLLSLLAASALAAPRPVPQAGETITVTEIVTATAGSPVAQKTAQHVIPKHKGRPAATKTTNTHNKKKHQGSLASAAPQASTSTSGGVDTSSWGYGLAYSPYANDGSCKSQDDINTDFQAFTDTYGVIRAYGTDCNQTATILTACQANNALLFAGVYDITEVQSEVQLIIDAAQSDWSSIAAVSIGNEGVNDGTYTVSAVVAAISSARSQLQAAGYTGPVVTVDTFDAIIANPQLCQASDFAAANCHAFFDADITADQAGSYVQQQMVNVQNACGGQDTVITESGWPSNGDANGDAVPSQANQDAAISSLRSSFSNNLILFSAFNNYWMANSASTFDSEWYWGIYGNSTTSGPAP